MDGSLPEEERLPLLPRTGAGCGSSGMMALEEQRAGGNTAARGDHRGVSAGYLPLAGIVSQLLHGFVEKSEAVGPPLRELATMGVDRQLAVEGDPAAVVQPVVGFPETAEAEGFEPRDGVEGEAVV